MGIRTPDLLIANETLYQLSYTPNRGNNNPLPMRYQDPLPQQNSTTAGVRSLESLVNDVFGSGVSFSAMLLLRSAEFVPGLP